MVRAGRLRIGFAPEGADASAGSDRHEHRRYWEQFYASTASSAVPPEPSPFARWVVTRLPVPGPVVDMGTGTGRDAQWLAGQGYDVLGLDYAESGLAVARASAEQFGVSVRFDQVNLYHRGETDAMAAKVAAELRPAAVYARFFVHALEEDGRANLWRFTRRALPDGGLCLLEFRTERTRHEFGEHFRHFVQPHTVVEELTALGATIEHCEEGRGLAVYKSEDPLVARIVARFPG